MSILEVDLESGGSYFCCCLTVPLRTAGVSRNGQQQVDRANIIKSLDYWRCRPKLVALRADID